MDSNFVEIDASLGGQIFRTALALSAVSLKPVKIVNIKKAREKQGLQAQHLATLNTIAKLCNAQVFGNKIGSTEVTFVPKKIQGQRIAVNIGTAGSTSLLLQSILLPSLFAGSPITLTITGGTDVPFSPPIQAIKHSLLPMLTKMNARFKIEIKRHGFMPKGNGLIVFSSQNSSLPLKPLKFSNFSELNHILIYSNANDLPKEVALLQSNAAKKFLEKQINAEIISEFSHTQTGSGKGSSIIITGILQNGCIIEADALGEKNLSAIKVGELAAKKFLEEFSAQNPVDSHLGDQLLPFLAVANGTSEIAVTKLTQHMLSNIKVIEAFLPAKIQVIGVLGEKATIVVQGIGLK